MRCFIAIDLPEKVKEEISNIQKKLPEARMNLVNPDNAHLTLKFIGEIDSKSAEKIRESIKEVKFDIKCRISGIGVFSPSFIRVIWISLEPEEKLGEIQLLIDNKLEELGFKREKKWKAHLTIARVKQIEDKQKFLEKLRKINIKPVDFNANNIKLKKSVLTSKGPVYEDL